MPAASQCRHSHRLACACASALSFARHPRQAAASEQCWHCTVVKARALVFSPPRVRRQRPTPAQGSSECGNRPSSRCSSHLAICRAPRCVSLCGLKMRQAAVQLVSLHPSLPLMSRELHTRPQTLRNARATPTPGPLEHSLRVGRVHSAALGHALTSLNAALQVAGPNFQLRADSRPLLPRNVALEQVPPNFACFAFHAFTSTPPLLGLLPAPMRASFDASDTTSAERVADGRRSSDSGRRGVDLSHAPFRSTRVQKPPQPRYGGLKSDVNLPIRLQKSVSMSAATRKHGWRLTGAERVVGAEELLARRKVLALGVDALEVVDVAVCQMAVSRARSTS
jgi:hypothetical protein